MIKINLCQLHIIIITIIIIVKLNIFYNVIHTRNFEFCNNIYFMTMLLIMYSNYKIELYYDNLSFNYHNVKRITFNYTKV